MSNLLLCRLCIADISSTIDAPGDSRDLFLDGDIGGIEELKMAFLLACCHDSFRQFHPSVAPISPEITDVRSFRACLDGDTLDYGNVLVVVVGKTINRYHYWQAKRPDILNLFDQVAGPFFDSLWIRFV